MNSFRIVISQAFMDTNIAAKLLYYKMGVREHCSTIIATNFYCFTSHVWITITGLTADNINILYCYRGNSDIVVDLIECGIL